MTIGLFAIIWILGVVGTMDYNTKIGAADSPGTIISLIVGLVVLVACGLKERAKR